MVEKGECFMKTKTKQRKGLLVMIVGPSGVGKTVVAEALRDIYGDVLGRAVTTTTRDSRPGERDGVDYHFITKGEFTTREQNQEFYETNAFAHMSHLYGTGRTHMDSALESHKAVLVVIDINGMSALERQISYTLPIFLTPGSFKDLERRLMKRSGADRDTVRSRLKTAVSELEAFSGLGSVVVNKDGELKTTIKEVKDLIDECLKKGQ